MKPTSSVLAMTIRAVANDIASGLEGGILELNDGSCEELAVAVFEQIGVPETADFQTLEIQNLCTGNDVFSPRPDHGLIERFWPLVVPPFPLSWDGIEELGMLETAHVWIVLDGRHHDADVPDGVENVFDLPVFRRNLVAGMKTRCSDALKGLEDVPWWSESIRLHEEFRDYAESRNGHRPCLST